MLLLVEEIMQQLLYIYIRNLIKSGIFFISTSDFFYKYHVCGFVSFPVAYALRQFRQDQVSLKGLYRSKSPSSVRIHFD